MKNLLLTTAITFMLSASAFAAGNDDHSHGEDHADDHAEMMVGMAGDPSKVDRTIDVILSENDEGGMVIEPAALDIVQGETIRFNVMNKGEIEHEFVIDTFEGNAKHKALMEEMDMEHDDPNSIRLDEGASGEVVWTFTNTGSFEFACLIPGHYESGMHGPITVGEEMAEAAVEYTTGEVKKINAKSGKVTIIHGPLVNLGMPSMTMVFRADEAMIAKMSVGQNIEFVADRIKGKLTVTQIK